MACVDRDIFNLKDHGNSAEIALSELLKVSKIQTGVLGVIINLIRERVLSAEVAFTWIPDRGNNAGNAAGFFRVNEAKVNRIELKGYALTIMEGKRSQLVHELVHCLDLSYYFFNIGHPPLAVKLLKRVPTLSLFVKGDIIKMNCMDLSFVDVNYVTQHNNALTYFIATARKNNLLKDWQRTMLLTQLEYAKRADKDHIEFTANVAQCLCLLYQWGFTGNEKGFLGNPRTVALMIKRMELELSASVASWRNYMPPARIAGAVYQMKATDAKPVLDKRHYEVDEWWNVVEEPLIPVPVPAAVA